MMAINDRLVQPAENTSELLGGLDVVVIPCWRRAEMLWHTLQHISHAENADTCHYIFRVDTGHSPEVLEVIKGFPFSYEVAMTPRTNYRHTKQSFSVLSGYMLGCDRSQGGLVFLIEEDIFIANDFFKWHRAIHAAHRDLFCSIGVANHNRTMVDAGDLDEYYLSSVDYCSWGVCFRSDVLRAGVLRHANMDYYQDPGAYIRRHLVGSPIGESFTEQDGLIRRIQWTQGASAPIAYPYRARAYHAGAYGYNRGDQPAGTLADRIKLVTSFAYSPESMLTFAERPEFVQDSIPVDLNTPPWQTLRMKPLHLQRNALRL